MRPKTNTLWGRWVARYRAWQAARKELVYPENVLEPESQGEGGTAATEKPARPHRP